MPYSRDTVLGGKLRVIRLVGEGGLGEVYEVEHLLTRHRRALKVLKPQWRTDTELVERFLREASAAGHIGNPHIVETFDAGTLDDGSPYLLMELLEGQSLDVVLRWHGRLEVGVAVRLMLQVCDAIAAAHDAGIVHRDLKPENLFLLKRDGRHFVKVLDFGISKFDTGLTGRPKVTNTFTSLGTPLYMSPEQMRATKDVDGRADVYAMAVILYEAVAGTTPFVADSFAELAAQALRGEAKPLHELMTDVPPALSRIVAQAMAPDRNHRHASPRELADELEPFATDGVTQLTEMPKARRPEVQHLAERQLTVSPYGPTESPNAPAERALTDEATPVAEALGAPRPAVTEEATPVARRPGETTARRLPVGRVALVVALLAVVGALGAVGLRATSSPESTAPSEPGVTPRVPDVAATVDEALSTVELPFQDPPVAAPPPATAVDEASPSEPPSAARAPSATAPRLASPVAKPRQVPARLKGLVSITCEQDPCSVRLPSGKVLQTPVVSEPSVSGLFEASDGQGQRKASLRVDFKEPGEAAKLHVDLEAGVFGRR